jgi:hypothetical protein
VLHGVTFDLEYGQDESSQSNTFEITIDRNSNVRLEDKALVYIEGTEYGGRVKGIGTSMDENVITYKGLTWHGILNAHVLGPDSGQDYLVLQGDAHTVLRSLIERMNLQDIFTAPMALSGINVNHQVRYEYGYFTILSMLAASSAKLKMTYENGMVVLSAKDIADYSQQDELDTTTQVSITIDQDYLPVNHLVCLGEGELKNRTVVHFYADANGTVSTTQSLFGSDENTLIYDYTNADRTELTEKGKEKLQELQNCNTVKADIPEGRVLDIGDVVGAIDPITGISVSTNVTYKTVVISSNGIVSVAYKVGEPSTSKSMSGRSESSGGGVSYSAGKGITIDGRTINADVDSSDLKTVNDLAQEAKTQASNAASTAAGAQVAADAAQQTADAAVATISASSPITAQRDGSTASLSHDNSGVSAGAYGPTSNVTADWGDTVNVGPRVSVNATGHITDAQGRTVTLPGNTATQDAKGLMSAADKTKLDGIEQNANKTTVDDALSSMSTNPVQNKAVKAALDDKSNSDHTHTAAEVGAAAETDLENYLPLTGGTLKGNVNINRGTSESNIQLIRTIEDKQVASYLLTNSLGQTALRCYETKDGSSTLLNELKLTSSETTLNKPLNVSSGGTGASNVAGARTNLLSNISDNPEAVNDNTRFLITNVSNTGNILRNSASSLWTWIKGKADSIYAALNHTHETDDITGLQSALDGKANSSHTHNYAGSSSPGGAATSANKLSTARTITLTGAVNGSAEFDGSGDITITTTGDSEAAGFLAAHPVGSVYESTSSTSPATTYGGTWKYCPGFEFHRWVRTA